MNRRKEQSTHNLLKILCVVFTLFLYGAMATHPVGQKRKRPAVLRKAEVREAEHLLSTLGYWTGRVDGVFDSASHYALIAFQKVEGREQTGRLTRDELDALRAANAPQPRDAGYAHVEVDLERQVLFVVGEDGTVKHILPISTGSDKHYDVKGMRGMAYTPRGRFRVYNKLNGWHKSPLGLLFYPNYISDGIAIHGNSAVPNNPDSHGCIRIPVFASEEFSRLTPLNTIVLVYDKQSFVSAKDWANQ
ncbi:MAG: hypothetical protein NVSMB56_13560 [Pyrinomonadaceae bacterium]